MLEEDATETSPSLRLDTLSVNQPPESLNISQRRDTDRPLINRKGVRFWAIVIALLLSTFFAVLEAVSPFSRCRTEKNPHCFQYSVSNALPVTVFDLHADSFVWTISAYGIASTALLPLSGILADVCS